MTAPPDTIGLIAGNGKLPLLVARGMRAAGLRVACVGLHGHFDPALPALCDAFHPVGPYRLNRWIRMLRRAGACEAVMVGGVSKARMHDPLRLVRHLPDWRALRLWYRRLRHDRRDAAVLAALADELGSAGIRLIDSTKHIPDHLATEGVLTSRPPDAGQRADIAFAWPIFRRIVDLHVGQSLAVREGDVIAVEALEGTDALIERAGRLCRRKGWTLIKGAADDHDLRADVPTVGVQTIERLAAAGAGCLAVEAGRVILLDRPAVLEAAERAGIAVVGVGRSGPAA